MWTIRCFLLVSVFAYPERQVSSELISNETRAWKFLFDMDEVSIYGCETGNFSSLDLTAQNFSWQNFTDPLLKRAFNLTAQKEIVTNSYERVSHLDEDKRTKVIQREMRDILYNSTSCVYHEEGKRETSENCIMLNHTQLIEMFYESKNIDEREYYWIAWHQSLGRMRNIFIEKMQLLEEMRILPNYNYQWSRFYEKSPEWIAQETGKAWQEMLPLYRELHAYVRKRLISFYGNNSMKRDGPIPEHILGFMATHWWTVEDIVLPYPEKDTNLTKVMEENNATNIDILKLSEIFFHSLGFPCLGESFWNNTSLKTGRHCITNYQFTCDIKINGITGCFPLIEFYLHQVIGSPVLVYVLNYERQFKWPQILRQLPNSAFAYGLRYAIELSTWTNEYMSNIGFVQHNPLNYGQIADEDINHLMKVALRHLAELPSVYKTERWKWDSLNFTISENDYNKKWWEYSLKYQGICPPVRRTEEDFDPAPSKTVARGWPTIQDFIGTVYGFQFYKAACNATGHTDFLHRCNLYGDVAFGNKIRELISLGWSKTGQEQISLMTDGESNNIDTKPLLEYFQPLYEWLQRENEGETIGWNSNDPMVCP